MAIIHELKTFAGSPNVFLFTQVATISSVGIFAGSSFNYNKVIMPSLRRFSSASSLAVWAEMFAYAAPIQLNTVVVSSLGGSILYYRTRNPYYLAGAAMMASIVPYTLTLLHPINTKLLNIRNHGLDDPTVESMLVQWDTLHFGRTLMSLGALAVTVYAALRGQEIIFEL
ncbi:hypothetical protein BGX34_007200 [Mortierella sp. NVP85]|nr:hypothetical protein BGX34_007200 [Mortierella sp. NVP85]